MRLIALLLLSCFHLDAYPCETLAEAERELSDVYRTAWATADEERRLLLERSQVAWFQYRQSNCAILATRAGVVEPEPQADCLAFMTHERTAELRIIGRLDDGEVACTAVD
jgi:uncharacterized protein YecT (DUF1311 family)